MSVRADNKASAAHPGAAAISALPLDVTDSNALSAAPEEGAALAEAAAVNPNFPLKRNVCVVIRASLNDFCLQKNKATWSPSPEALKQIFQCVPFLSNSHTTRRAHASLCVCGRQKKFTDLSGAAEQQGDLRSIVLHSMKLSHVKSSFPFSIGARMTGVDDITYSHTGEPFSTIGELTSLLACASCRTHAATAIASRSRSPSQLRVRRGQEPPGRRHRARLRVCEEGDFFAAFPTPAPLKSEFSHTHVCFCRRSSRATHHQTWAPRAFTRSRPVASCSWQRYVPPTTTPFPHAPSDAINPHSFPILLLAFLGPSDRLGHLGACSIPEKHTTIFVCLSVFLHP